MIGLEKGRVRLAPHDAEWEAEAERTVAELRALLGDAALDIQHVGSTSVPTIMAKPIIDIAVSAAGFSSVLKHHTAAMLYFLLVYFLSIGIISYITCKV